MNVFWTNCNLCYRWIIFDSPRMISNPSYLCNSCFRSYHYINGRKIGTFTAVRYWDCPAFCKVFDNISEQNQINSVDDDEIESIEEEIVECWSGVDLLYFILKFFVFLYCSVCFLIYFEFVFIFFNSFNLFLIYPIFNEIR